VRQAALLALVVACGGSDDVQTQPIDANVADAAPADALFTGDPLIGKGATTLVDMGYQFTEGPQWRESDLVFSDIPASTIFRLDPAGPSIMIHRMPSGNANGLAWHGGSLYAAQHDRTLTRDGAVIASMFGGNPHNRRNDVVVAGNGTVYFTDPPYGLSGGTGDQGFMGVYRLSGVTLTAEYRGATTERPNGVGISRDGATVYVADTADGNVYAFSVASTGALSARTVFATTSGGADGLAVDAAGNVFVATSSGMGVFASDGGRWGPIGVPMQPSNCAFGDAYHKTLYITARSQLYKVRLANAGLPYN